MPDTREAERKATILDALLKKTAALGDSAGTLAVAYSGGLDSRFLIHMVRRAGLVVLALHARGPHIPAHESEYAVQWAEAAGVPLTVVEFDPLQLPEMGNNPKDRCYHCKKAIFSALLRVKGNFPLCDGTNASDLGEYRPGLRALREAGVRSPLAEAGLEKKDIRTIAAMTGMENPDQAAQPCLLTRFRYGAAITAASLAAVDTAEAAVRRFFAASGRHAEPFRIRYEDDFTVALHLVRHLPADEVADLETVLAQAGFPGAPVRETASLSGYFDRT